MSVDKEFVLNALVAHNFLPMQKEKREELPPIFSSLTFTPEVARKLAHGKARKAEGYQGYDVVDYKLTRFNAVPRSCSIPHPKPYAELALCIYESWDSLSYITENENSRIVPREHPDGRIIIMDYEKSLEKTSRYLKNAFGKRFIVNTDISSCFPTIYSHAIPWATVGFENAKKHKPPKYKEEWFNRLDERIRGLKRNETHGIAIGPATSNIVCEAILARVDEVLKKEFLFTRFIDDYTAFCHTEQQGQEFVRKLSLELARYKLLLNIQKTEAVPLPQALAADWVSELSLRLPKGEELSTYDAINYLNLAVGLSRQTPDGSVLKYALRSVVNRKIELLGEFDVLDYALALSFHHPILMPFLETLFDATLPWLGKFVFGERLQQLASENAKLFRSDGVVWALYYLNKYGIPIETATADLVLASRDCVSLLMLYRSSEACRAQVIKFAESLDKTDLYELDEYWLLTYELFREEKIATPYANEDAFEILSDNGVTFLNS